MAIPVSLAFIGNTILPIKLKPKKPTAEAHETDQSTVVSSKSDGFLYDKPLPAVVSTATIIDARSADYDKLAKSTIRPSGPKRPPYKLQATAKPANVNIGRAGATLAEKASVADRRPDSPHVAQAEVTGDTSASREFKVPTDGNNSPKQVSLSVSGPGDSQPDNDILQAAPSESTRAGTSKNLRSGAMITSETLPNQEALTTPLVQPKDAQEAVTTALPTSVPSLSPAPVPVPVRLSSGREQLFAAKLKDLNIGQSGFITFPEFLQLCPRVGLDEESYKASCWPRADKNFQFILIQYLLKWEVKSRDPVLHDSAVPTESDILFRSLDEDNTGLVRGTDVVRFWQKHSIKDPAAMLEFLGFSENAAINRTVLAKALENAMQSEGLFSSTTFATAVSAMNAIEYLRNAESRQKRELEIKAEEIQHLLNVVNNLEKNRLEDREKLLDSEKRCVRTVKELESCKTSMRQMEHELSRLRAAQALKSHGFVNEDIAQLTELKRNLEREIEEMRASRQLDEQFAKKVEQLSSTSDKIAFDLFRKNEAFSAIQEAVASIKKAENERLLAEQKHNEILQAANDRLQKEVADLTSSYREQTKRLEELEFSGSELAAVCTQTKEAKEEALHDLENTRNALENEMKFSDFQKKERERLEALLEKLTEDLAKTQKLIAQNEEADQQRVRYISELEAKLHAFEAQNREKVGFAERPASCYPLDAAADRVSACHISSDVKNQKASSEHREQIELLLAKVQDLNGRISSLEGQLERQNDKLMTPRSTMISRGMQTENLRRQTTPTNKSNVIIELDGVSSEHLDASRNCATQTRWPNCVSRETATSMEEIVMPSHPGMAYMAENFTGRTKPPSAVQCTEPRLADVESLHEKLVQKERTIQDLRKRLCESVPGVQYQHVLDCLKRAEARRSRGQAFEVQSELPAKR
ncbi:hypothetical protein SprV_0401566800 [Sparganum proliferum]